MARVVDPASQDKDGSLNRARNRLTKQRKGSVYEDEQVLLISQAFRQSMTQVEQRRGTHMRIPRLPVGFSANIFHGERFTFVGSFNDQPLETAKMMVELVGGQVVELDMHPTRIITGRNIPKKTSDRVNRLVDSREGILSHSLRDFMLLFFELSRTSRAAKSTVEPANELALDNGEHGTDKLSSTPTALKEVSPERISSVAKDSSNRNSPSVLERPVKLSKPVFYDKHYQPWDIYIDEAIPESIRDRLAQQISTSGGRLVPASQADIILFDPHHPTHPSGPTTTDGNPEANLRPWHWVFFCLQEKKLLKTCLMESQVPVFVKKKNETEPYGDQGGMLACWLADKVPERLKLEKMILSYGGLVTRRRQNAFIFIIDPGSADKETLDIIHVYSHDRSRYVLSYDWVTTCVELGEIARLPIDQPSHTPVPDGRSNSHRFTAEDDRHLVQFIAQELFDQERLPRRGQRIGDKGNKLYQLLVSTSYKPEKPRPWAFNHPWESWRTRYKNQAHLGMERAVQKTIGRLQQGLPLEPSSSPSPSPSVPSAAPSIQQRPASDRSNTLRKGKGRADENFDESGSSDRYDDDADYQDREDSSSGRADEVNYPPSIRPRKTISEMMAPYRPSRPVQRLPPVISERPAPSSPAPSSPLEGPARQKLKHPLAASQYSSSSTPQPKSTTNHDPESEAKSIEDEEEGFDRIAVQSHLELTDEDDVEGTLGDPNFEFNSDLNFESESAPEYPGESTQRVKLLMNTFLDDPASVETNPIGASQDSSVSWMAKRKREDYGVAGEEEEEEGPETYQCDCDDRCPLSTSQKMMRMT
ncbi:Homeodomain-like [Phaffia rhodozyma]|uniref:Homeodomain-like n=1 Tax=Phaffia rhodozyma TaxID=264483 RepID=A0A0F7SJY8_PHARH|nr:Homeodomain-like [Phaffia rhodozyma]